MKKKNRDVEVFSLSALDLFASAMGGFVLLTVMMLPYYFKGKEYEERIGQLAPSVSKAVAEAESGKLEEAQMKAALEEVKAPKKVSTSKEQSELALERARARALSVKVASLKSGIISAKKTLAASPIIKKPKKNKVTFRFLGLKTDRDTYLILVDGAARIKSTAPNLPEILKRIVSVMGTGRKFALAFYRFEDRKFVYQRWPDAKGFAEGGTDSQAKAVDFMRNEYRSMGGGSATYQALLEALGDTADAIVLVSDGIIFPPHNEGRSGDRIVGEVGLKNRSATEIHSVAIGRFYRNPRFYGFLHDLSGRNRGDLKAIPP